MSSLSSLPPQLPSPLPLNSYAAKMALVLGSAQSQDTDLVSPPSDSISALSFSPNADILAVSSWDNAVRPLPSHSLSDQVLEADFTTAVIFLLSTRSVCTRPTRRVSRSRRQSTDTRDPSSTFAGLPYVAPLPPVPLSFFPCPWSEGRLAVGARTETCIRARLVSQDGSKVFSCGADKAGRMYDLATGQSCTCPLRLLHLPTLAPRESWCMGRGSLVDGVGRLEVPQSGDRLVGRHVQLSDLGRKELKGTP